MPKIKDIQPTPNINSMRFILREPITRGVAKEYTTEDEIDDKLASKLFEFEGVENIYYVDRYVTVTQDGSREWNKLLREVAEPIRQSQMISEDDEKKWEKLTENSSEDPLVKKINEELDKEIRPYLLSDGGGIDVIAVDDKTVTINYKGACSSCAISMSSTLDGIERMLKMSVDPELELRVV